MESQQDWQTADPNQYDSDRLFGYHLSDGTLIDAAGNRLDDIQHHIANTEPWMPAQQGSVGAMPGEPGDSQMPYGVCPNLGDSHAGPSNYALYHQPHNQAYAMPYGHLSGKGARGAQADLISPRLAGHFPPEQSQEFLNPGAGPAQTPAPNPKSRPKPYSSATTTTRNYSNGNVGPSLKRGMACGFCRRRKLKCDAERPVCANCTKYKKECEYVHPLKSSESEDATEQGQETLSTPISALPEKRGTLSRNVSSSSVTEALISPTNPPTFFGQSFPPRFGTDVMLQGHHTSMPMGPPGFATSPDGMGPQNFMTSAYNYPFTSQPLPSAPAMVSTPQTEIPVPTHPQSDQSSSNTTQFSQYGTLSFPPWATVQTSSPYAMPAQLMNAPQTAPIHTVPLPDTFDIKPQISSSEAQVPSSYTYCNPSEFYRRPPEQIPEPPARARQDTGQSADSLRSLRSTPDPNEAPPPSMMVDPNSPYTYAFPPPQHNVLYTAGDDRPKLSIDPMDGLTARLGEFLFAPSDPPPMPKMGMQRPEEGSAKRRKPSMSSERRDAGVPSMGLIQQQAESDGLTITARDQLLSIFLAHSRLFFEMSVPRFKYRMSFDDKRRPSLALLNAMYLWASRIGSAPGKSPLEEAFFIAGCRTLEAQTSRADRLLDGMRAAMLLSAYAYTNGRYHEGFLLAGVGIRLVTSTGIHQIPSCSFTPPATRNPLLRQKTFLLPPPEDKIELAERIHTFWALISIERCGSLATGFPTALRDEDIITPFPRPMVDIASGNVTSNDDVTIRDLYRFSSLEVEDDSKVVKWIKALLIIERSAKLAFIDPTDDSEYANAMSAHVMAHPSAPVPPPPAWMDQPKYRCPGEYRIVKLGLDQFLQSMGVEGIFPVDRKRNAQIDGAAEPFISSHTMVMHHILAASYMFLHDINSIECENAEALVGARKCVSLFRYLSPIPVSDVDSFAVVIWGMVARTLIKEMHRLRILGDMANASVVEEEAEVIMREVQRVGETMGISKTQAMGLEALKSMDSRSFVAENGSSASGGSK